MDLRHADPRMARDHDLRVMPGPGGPQMGIGAAMGMGIPPSMPGQPIVRPPQPMGDMDQ